MKRVFLCAALMAYATVSLSEVPVQKVRWKFCEAAASEGWTVSAENPTGTAFGADLSVWMARPALVIGSSACIPK